MDNIKPLNKLCAELGITANVKELNRHNNKGGLTKFPEWAKQGWSITLKYNKKRSQFRYYGGGLSNTPTASDLIYSVATDSNTLNESFNEWCMENGYDTDSIKALSIYKACQTNANRLKKLISDENLFSQLVESAGAY